MTDPFACQCSRFDQPCRTRATQEDMLCDACRAGCSLLKFGHPETPDSPPAQHVVVEEFSFAPLPPYGQQLPAPSVEG